MNVDFTNVINHVTIIKPQPGMLFTRCEQQQQCEGAFEFFAQNKT